MANSKFEYVRLFEQPDVLLPNTWIVVRIDGRGFHKLSDHYGFQKPNDRRALDLMNAAAVEVMKDLPDLCIAYGVSDEYSFVFHPTCQLFERRSADMSRKCFVFAKEENRKLTTTIVSTFTAHYIQKWNSFFPERGLESPYLPSFDGRAVVYPTTQNLRDYMSWRQVDCHINNLYNTTFWAMVKQGGMTNTDAEYELKGTVSSDKNEILFKRFGINYNNEPEMYKKGSVVYRQYQLQEPKPKPEPGVQGPTEESGPAAAQYTEASKTQQEKARKLRRKAHVVVDHVDIIKDGFWEMRPWILSNKPGKLPTSEVT